MEEIKIKEMEKKTCSVLSGWQAFEKWQTSLPPGGHLQHEAQAGAGEASHGIME